MQRTSLTLSTLALIAASASAQTPLYHFAFDDAGGDPTVNSGSGPVVATMNGSVVLTAPGSYGNSLSHGLWNSAGGTNPNGDAIDLDLTGQGVQFAGFQLSLDVLFNSSTQKFDDWISFTIDDGSLYHFVTNGGPSGLMPGVTFTGPTSSENITNTAVLNDGNWHTLALTVVASGPDALFEYFVDGVSMGTNMHLGGASMNLVHVQVGGRYDGLHNRYMSGGIDDVILSTGPAPSNAFCFGDGSGTACPCGNTGGAGEGCANSSGAGAILSEQGSVSVGADDLSFAGSNLLANQPALLFVGVNAVNGGSGSLFGDGLRCAGGSVVRLGVQVPDGGGAASWAAGMQPAGGWTAGDTRYFQLWYRDPSGSPCGNGYNLSNGVGLTFGS
jgi:hypothetical protein